MLTFMVVDDEHMLVNLLENFLVERGYRVVTALNGETALDLFKKEHPRIIFLDIRMPEMDGLEVLRALKANDEQVKVIMVTIVDDQETISLAKALGADDYITKPFDLEYVEDVIIRMVSETVHEEGGWS